MERFLAYKTVLTQIDPQSVMRGRAYHAQGRVINFSVDLKQKALVAKVRGRLNHLYTVNIEFLPVDRDAVALIDECTCPLGGDCKHVVATLCEAKKRGFSFEIPGLYDDEEAPYKDEIKKLPRHVIHASPAPSAFERWLATTNNPTGTLSQTKPKDEFALIYFLSSYQNNPAILQVELKMSRLLKKGGYGKPQPFRFGSSSQFAHLQEVDEEIIASLYFMSQSDLQGFNKVQLKGKKSALLLQKMVETGRCFWQKLSDHPLTFAKTQPLTLHWELADNASQTLVMRAAGLQANIYPLETWCYYLPNEHKMGFLELPIAQEKLQQLATLPAIKPAESQEAHTVLKNMLPDCEDSFLPTKFNEPTILHDVKIIPELHLDMLEFELPSPYRYYNAPKETIKLPVATIAFDYAGQKIPFTMDDNYIMQTPTYIEQGVVYSCVRNFEQEENYLLQLAKTIPLKTLPDVKTNSPGQHYEISNLKSEEDFFEFSASTLTALEQQGWRVYRHHDAFVALVYDDEISWYSDLDEKSSYDYFSLDMGIIVNNEQVSVLPLIANLLQKHKNVDFATMADNDMLPLPLPDGKVLMLPGARIKPMIAILVELYDSESLTDGQLTLSKHQASLLHEIEKAFQSAKMRWLGGNKLRTLGQKLAEFSHVKSVTVPKTFQAQLRPYQQAGVNWLQFLREYQLAGILADDMGLGKTVQTLAHLSVEKAQGRMQKPSLIIAPTSLMTNWYLEAKQFAPNVTLLVFHGDERHAYSDNITQYDVMITSYSLLIRDKDLLLKHDYHYLILDEAHFIKNYKAKSTQIVHQLKADHRLCLTGTPMENHLGELWSLYHFLMPGLLGDHQQFSRLFRRPIEKNNDQQRRQILAQRIKPFLLRRHKSDVVKELPEKTEIIRKVELEGAQRDLYESIRLAMQEKIRKAIQSKGLARSHIIILDALLKLRQTCCDPKLLKLTSAKAAHKHSAKMDLLMELLPNMIEEGRKVLLFSQFTSMLSIIEEALQKANINYVKLTGATKDRAKPIAAFQEGAVPLFLISLKAGGTGLNLTAADTVIHYDPWWNPAVEDQATDRAHRIGQQKSVFVYKLLSMGTIEETIQDMQERKRQLVSGLFSEQAGSKLELTTDDLAQLFKPIGAV